MPDIQIHESKYGEDPCNFHIAKVGDELQVELIYPPHTSRKDGGGKCKYVCVNQESARATGPTTTRCWITTGARSPS